MTLVKSAGRYSFASLTSYDTMQTGVKGPGRLTPALRGACLQVPTLAAGQQLPTSQSAAVYRRLGTSSPVEVSLRQYCQALKRRMHSHVAVAAAAGSGPGPGPGGAAGAGSAGGGGGRAAAYSLARRRGPEVRPHSHTPHPALSSCPHACCTELHHNAAALCSLCHDQSPPPLERA